jgi:hypothetical protein
LPPRAEGDPVGLYDRLNFRDCSHFLKKAGFAFLASSIDFCSAMTFWSNDSDIDALSDLSSDCAYVPVPEVNVNKSAAEQISLNCISVTPYVTYEARANRIFVIRSPTFLQFITALGSTSWLYEAPEAKGVLSIRVVKS